MTTRMLIDARHREETRVAVVKGNRIEEFDFESAERKQLKGNIYLAKVTRVEPSLQAAFIDYGGNRHGFLAFSEIHPDYYQIPKEDRDALLREEAEHAAEEAALRADHDDDDDVGGEDLQEIDEDSVERFEDDGGHDDLHDDDDHADDEDPSEAKPPRKGNGTDDQVEALRQRRMNLRRRYKIQDVIRRRQVLLVQVVKEERGNKGAALTTYLSLAGRYCVLMPNTSNGGGISRKISNAGDRKRLKSIMADLALPSSMGCIVRTAGLQRTRQEIKRDFDYLARLWDGIREETLKSSAPAVVYGDSDLMKRAIRDIYNKDVDEVIVEGEAGYRQAREFMKLLMPTHARRVKHYSDAVPLFQRAGVEDQLSAMYHPVVQLKSGGYLVINPTEALVSIDINSGRSTREHNIEQTATATNLEAAAEIGRQLRLRDMAGLVVIDFIDMDNNSNVRKVEKAMKEALKNDRARIQVGRISSFGLMEMSRQRLRTGVLEASTRGCPHCEGTGLIRTASSAGLSALRMVEDEAARGRGSLLTLRASQEAAFYVLNRKRGDIAEIEERYGVQVEILPDGEQEGARMSVEASGPPPAHAPRFEPLIIEDDEDDLPEEIEDEVEEDAVADAEPAEEGDTPRRAARPERAERAEDDSEGGRKRRRRRGRRGRASPEGEAEAGESAESLDAEGEMVEGDVDSDAEPTFAGEQPVAEDESGGDGRRRRGRRGRRGGRRGEANGIEAQEAVGDDSGDALVIGDEGTSETASADTFVGEPPVAEAAEVAPVEEVEAAAPKARRRPRARAATASLDAAPADERPEEPEEPEAPEPAPKRKRAPRKALADAPAVPEPGEVAAPINEPIAPEAIAEESAKPKRTRRRKADADASPEPVADAGDAGSSAVNALIAEVAAAPAGGTASGVAGDEDTASDDPDQPGPRRGWWQRTFGA